MAAGRNFAPNNSTLPLPCFAERTTGMGLFSKKSKSRLQKRPFTVANCLGRTKAAAVRLTAAREALGSMATIIEPSLLLFQKDPETFAKMMTDRNAECLLVRSLAEEILALAEQSKWDYMVAKNATEGKQSRDYKKALATMKVLSYRMEREEPLAEETIKQMNLIFSHTLNVALPSFEDLVKAKEEILKQMKAE